MVLFNGAILWHACTRHNVPVLHPYMIILCDPIWQVKSRSCEVGFQQRAISFSPFNDRFVFCLYRQCLYTVRPRDVDSVSVRMCTADWRHIPGTGMCALAVVEGRHAVCCAIYSRIRQTAMKLHAIRRPTTLNRDILLTLFTVSNAG